MPPSEKWKVDPGDRRILRDLARKKLDQAHSEVNQERRRAWYALDEGRAERPMILCEWWPALELKDSGLKCREEWARKVEWGFHAGFFEHEVIRDDHVVEPVFDCGWRVQASNYGVEAVQHQPDNDGQLGARTWEHPIKDLDRDFDKLKPRTFTVDRDTSIAWKIHMDELLGDILTVRMRGAHWWTMGMTIVAVELIGLENLMLYMYDNPEGLHRIMAFLRDDHLAFARWCEREGVLNLNNENDYIGSGSMGYTRALPQPGWKSGDPVRMKDLWVLIESQETVGVGPDLFEEFIFPYQLEIAREFGQCYYGCCEPVHSRWEVLRKLPGLKRVSVSPWCDQRFMAEVLGRDIVFSRKPNPTLVSTPSFSEEAIRKDLRATLETAGGCNIEIILKDVHTLCGEPWRMARWVEIAREETTQGR